MRLKNLLVSSFRNIEMTRVELDMKFNLFYGFNGQGKTNFLEAIYLLGNPRSFRNSRLPDLIRHGHSQAIVSGEVESCGTVSQIRLSLETAGRRVEIDKKGIKRASELHGILNSVVFSPDDSRMVKSGPEVRRRYLDRTVYTGDVGYLRCWVDFNRVLKQRNYLLKSADKSGLDVWTEKLADTGAEVIERRKRYVALLEKQLEQHYTAISGGSETVGIIYKPDGVQTSDRYRIREELLQLFDRHGKTDERYGTTTAGPHRDDLIFCIDNRPLKAFGSQGQQKSFVLALKMAEMENLQTIFNEPPLLLLDDMSSELDAQRNSNFLDFILSRDIQVFITTTEPSSALLATAAHCSVFQVKNGNLTSEGNESND